MNTRRLRQIMFRYGVAGTLLVGVVLLMHHVRQHRRFKVSILLSGAVTLLVCLTLRFVSQQYGSVVPARMAGSANRSLASPVFESPIERKSVSVLLRTVNMILSGDRWRFEIWSGNGNEQRLLCYRNGVLVRTVRAGEICGNEGYYFLQVGRVPLRHGEPVIAVRSSSGIGYHLATRFYRVRGGALIQMIECDGDCGGPILRDTDYDGTPEWIFDDYDWYGMDPRIASQDQAVDYDIYQEQPDGTLKLWKRDEVTHPRLPFMDISEPPTESTQY